MLTLRLVVRQAEWYPEASTGPHVRVPAFGEEGRPPEIPGPFIRVPAGTEVRASVRNALPDSAVTIHGLVARPGNGRDSLVIQPGAIRSVHFRLDAPGTYLYWATVAPDNSRDSEQEQLAAAIVVDPPGAPVPDRVLVINIWGQLQDSVTYRNAVAINGRSWPYTERFEATVGDSLRWRWINASTRRHPMHLHGFYFRVDSRGDAFRDTTYQSSARELAVTEDMPWRSTFLMTWSPDREGHWLYHCHITFHATADARLDPPASDSSHLWHDPGRHMAGLVVGMDVKPRADSPRSTRPSPRQLRLHVQEGKRLGRAPRTLGFVLEQSGVPPAADSVRVPGSPLILTKDEATDITVLNHLREPTSIHWHGIELESWSDGVAGWSGTDRSTAPAIMPGDSFTAHLVLPRAGTFIYHTHLNDVEQLTSGLYGAIVVLPRGQSFDSATDHLMVVGWDGDADPPHFLLNGDSLPPPLVLATGVGHRFRLVNIGPAARVHISIVRDSKPARWRAIAKDGADRPSPQATERSAIQVVQVGETFDFLFQPVAPGGYRLLVGPPGGAPRVSQELRVE